MLCEANSEDKPHMMLQMEEINVDIRHCRNPHEQLTSSMSLTTLPPIAEQTIVLSVYDYNHICRNARLISTKFFLHITYGRGSVLL